MKNDGFGGQVERLGIGAIKIKGSVYTYGRFIEAQEFEKYWPFKPTPEIDL